MRRTRAGGDSGDALARADLLERAQRLYTQHPAEHACPVCQTPGALDATWAQQAAAQIATLRDQAAVATATRQALRTVANNLRALCHNPPPGLPEQLCKLWEAWAQCREIQDAAQLADAAEERARRLAEACRLVREGARRRLTELDDQWLALVPRLAAWLRLADEAAAAKPVLAHVKKARAWLKDVHAEIRDTRMRAIAAQAQEIWGYLSQESNVSLGAVTLSGSEHYSGRNVALNVTVDDVDASALGVVSQGELFSLALALFLPRATSELSPFDFIVVDDPVQSMDPRKVEGLARLLEKVAATHQVVVFTHDDRLAEVLRYHQIKATIRTVKRGFRSQVTIDSSDDPVKRELKAAHDLAKDRKVPSEILDEILPGQCRLALEAALREPVHRKLISAGLGRTEIADRIAKAGQLIELASLALFGDKREGNEVYDELKRRVGEEATRVVRLCNRGSHGTIKETAQAEAFVTRVQKAAERLSAL